MNSNRYIEKIIDKIKSKRYNELSEQNFKDIILYFINKNEWAKALEILNIAEILFPDNYELNVYKIQLLIETNKNIEAENLIKKLLKINYFDIRLWLFRGVNFASLGIFNRSLKIFNFIETEFSFDKKHVFSYIGKIFINYIRFDIAIRYLKKALEQDPDDLDIILDLAYALEKENRYTESLNLYLKYVQSDAFSKEVWHNIGILYTKLNNYSKAIEAYNYALAIDENFFPVLINKANLYIKRKYYLHALGLLNKAEKINPSDIDLLALKGYVYYHLKLYKKAIKFLKKSFNKGNKRHELKEYIIKTYCKTNKKEAILFIKQNLKQNTNDHNMWFFAAKYFHTRKEFNKSLKSIKKAIKSYPFEAEYWFLASDIFLRNGDTNASIKNLLLSRLFLNNKEKIYLKIISILLHSGKHSKAKEIFKNIEQKDKKALDKLSRIHPYKKHLEILFD